MIIVFKLSTKISYHDEIDSYSMEQENIHIDVYLHTFAIVEQSTAKKNKIRTKNNNKMKY